MKTGIVADDFLVEYGKRHEDISDVAEILDKLPKYHLSKDGEWYENKTRNPLYDKKYPWICSECARTVQVQSPFCPECGSRMIGDSNGEIH